MREGAGSLTGGGESGRRSCANKLPEKATSSSPAEHNAGPAVARKNIFALFILEAFRGCHYNSVARLVRRLIPAMVAALCVLGTIVAFNSPATGTRET